MDTFPEECPACPEGPILFTFCVLFIFVILPIIFMHIYRKYKDTFYKKTEDEQKAILTAPERFFRLGLPKPVPASQVCEFKMLMKRHITNRFLV